MFWRLPAARGSMAVVVLLCADPADSCWCPSMICHKTHAQTPRERLDSKKGTMWGDQHCIAQAPLLLLQGSPNIHLICAFPIAQQSTSITAQSTPRTPA